MWTGQAGSPGPGHWEEAEPRVRQVNTAREGSGAQSWAGRAELPLCWSLAEKASWLGEQPQCWSKAQVLDWISYQIEKNKVDASTIDFSRCDMDGATLCSCTPEELRLVFGPLGDQLYSQLWDHRECRPGAPGSPAQLGKLVQGLAPCPEPRSARLWEGPASESP